MHAASTILLPLRAPIIRPFSSAMELIGHQSTHNLIILAPKSSMRMSSTDKFADAAMAGLSSEFQVNPSKACSDLRLRELQTATAGRPWKYRVVLDELDAQFILQNESGAADAMIKISLQKEISADGPVREWHDGRSVQTLQAWLADADGHLKLPSMMQIGGQNGHGRIGRLPDRTRLDEAQQVATDLVYLYILAHCLTIKDLENAVLEQWHRCFDHDPELVHLHLGALSILKENEVVDSALATAALEEVAFACLSQAERVTGQVQSAEWLLQRVPSVARHLLAGQNELDHGFLGGPVSEEYEGQY